MPLAVSMSGSNNLLSYGHHTSYLSIDINIHPSKIPIYIYRHGLHKEPEVAYSTVHYITEVPVMEQLALAHPPPGLLCRVSLKSTSPYHVMANRATPSGSYLLLYAIQSRAPLRS